MIVPSFRLTESELSGGLIQSVSGLDSTVCEATITTIRLRMAHPKPSLDGPRRDSLTSVNEFDAGSNPLIRQYYGDVADNLIGKAETSPIMYN
jgi:hypothetical protein